MARKAEVPRRESLSIAILLVGGFGYLLVCGPAIGQRGFPPIDPIWTSMTFLWPIPLLLSCWFDSWSFGSRRTALWSYALGTAFVDSGTPVWIVPKLGIDPVAMAIATIIFYGPVHVAVTFGLEAIVQSVLGKWRTVIAPDETADDVNRPRFSLLAWFYCFTVICVGIGFPFAFRHLVFFSKHHRATVQAEADWSAGTAAVYRDPEAINFPGGWMVYEIDRETGLPARRQFVSEVYAKAYNRRIMQLLNEESTASRRSIDLPSPDELVALLDSSDLREVTEFPYEVTPNIVVFRRGTISRWGHTASNLSDALSITTKTGGVMGVGNGVQPVFVGSICGYPELIVIRNGTNWAGVFRHDGQAVASVSRFP
jgi:hypothetical protein